MMNSINVARFPSIIWISLFLFACATTQHAQLVKEGQVIDMGIYTVAAPPGEWAIQKEEKLELIKKHVWIGGQEKGTTSISVINIEAEPRQWHLSEEEMANSIINNKEKDMNEGVKKGLFEIYGSEKDVETVDGKKLFVLSYRATKAFRALEMATYVYLPPDYRIKHQFYVFNIGTDFERGNMFFRSDLTIIYPFIKSFKITTLPLELPAGINGDLIKAVNENNVEKIKGLLTQGADVNAKTKDGVTPLMGISMIGNVELARLLIEKGAKINEKDQQGRTPLMYGAYWNQSEIVNLLIEKGADINAQADGLSALIVALDKNATATAKVLIIKGANVNLKDNKGYTYLMAAAYKGNVEMARILIEKGAEVNAESADGFTALKIAKENGQIEIVRLLKEAGAKK